MIRQLQIFFFLNQALFQVKDISLPMCFLKKALQRKRVQKYFAFKYILWWCSMFLNIPSKKAMSVQDSHTSKHLLSSIGNFPSTKVKLTWHLLEGTVLPFPSICAVTFAWEPRLHWVTASQLSSYSGCNSLLCFATSVAGTQYPQGMSQPGQ